MIKLLIEFLQIDRTCEGGQFLLWYNEVMATNTTPLEDEEQINFIAELENRGYKFWHTNNEMWTKSWKQKAKSKAMGVQSGIPDLFICFKQGIVGFEMKRQKGGVVSPTQKYWHKILEAAKIPCYICRGCEHAIETLDYLESEGWEKIDLDLIWQWDEELLKEQMGLDKIEKKAKKTTKSTKKSKNDLPY